MAAANVARNQAIKAATQPASKMADQIALRLANGETAVCPLPKCDGTVAADIVPLYRDNQRGERVKVRDVAQWMCSSCLWAIWPDYYPGFRWVYGGKPVPPTCPKGHRRSWGARIIAGRGDLRCLGVSRGTVCGAQKTIAAPPRGFLNGTGPGLPPLYTKVKVLLALHLAGGSGSTGVIRAGTGQLGDPLTEGQVSGCLGRCRSSGMVTRSRTPVWVPPGTQGYVWSLTERGKSFLKWGSQVGGLIESETATAAGLLSEAILPPPEEEMVPASARPPYVNRFGQSGG